jgi:hypothetical protein
MLLWNLAGMATGNVSCLRVGPDGARLLGADFVAEEPEGTASYLWVLWSGSPPTIEEMVASHDEHVRVVRRGEP